MDTSGCSEKCHHPIYFSFYFEEEPARKYALYIPSLGKRGPGCPLTFYLAYIQLLLHIGYDVWKDDENEMAAEEIALPPLAKINVPTVKDDGDNVLLYSILVL